MDSHSRKCESFPLSKSFEEFISYLTVLANEEHKYRTVVVDTIDWLERLIWDHCCKNYGVKSIEKVENGFGKGYIIALTYWRQVIDLLRVLRDQKGMIVVLLAHAKVENFADPESSPLSRFSPRIHKAATSLVCERVDAVLLATRELGASRGVKGGDRIFRTFDWKALIQAMSTSLKKEK